MVVKYLRARPLPVEFLAGILPHSLAKISMLREITSQVLYLSDGRSDGRAMGEVPRVPDL